LDISITERGRTTDSWHGVTNEFARKGQNREFVPRGDRREDMTMPMAFVKKLDLPEVLKPLTTQLSHVMRKEPKPELQTWNIIHVPPGCDEQELHFDDEERHDDNRYVTILVSLNSIPKESGGTYFEKFGTVQTRPGDALVFTGNLSHKGTANTSNISRYFFYATYSCFPDENA
jgi:ectoine hydroxylase-related dioxygenase (phytanoyl-CoA dioxygenase family)